MLNIEQLKSLLEYLKEPGKTAVLLDILTGLRVRELLALKWSDVDFENLELHVPRSISLQRVGPCAFGKFSWPTCGSQVWPICGRLLDSEVGWHAFRYSFATILKSHRKDVKTVQELLRDPLEQNQGSYTQRRFYMQCWISLAKGPR